MKDTIKTLFYEYDPARFMPVFVNGKLVNKSHFIAYKINAFITRKSLV